MKTQGFKHIYANVGIFIYKDSKGRYVITLVYIDDGLFMGTDRTLVDKKKPACLKHWECHDTGKVTEFLSMKVTWW